MVRKKANWKKKFSLSLSSSKYIRTDICWKKGLANSAAADWLYNKANQIWKRKQEISCLDWIRIESKSPWRTKRKHFLPFEGCSNWKWKASTSYSTNIKSWLADELQYYDIFKVSDVFSDYVCFVRYVCMWIPREKIPKEREIPYWC